MKKAAGATQGKALFSVHRCGVFMMQLGVVTVTCIDGGEGDTLKKREPAEW